MSEERSVTSAPENPFPGINPYGYAERSVFFGRDSESQRLLRLVVMHRAVLLYSSSGIGKSSLINAGLIPELVKLGYEAHRVRVHPHPGQELIVESVGDLDQGCREVTSVGDCWDLIERNSATTDQLLVFDQFEEWVSLFEERQPGQSIASTAEAQGSIVRFIARLIHDRELRVKVVIALREDYLAGLTPLFELCPNLPDNYLRLTALAPEQIGGIIHRPFTENAGHYPRELSRHLAERIADQFAERGKGSEISLTEVQIVCRSLFEAKQEPEAELHARGGVQGILERYLEASLDSLGAERRGPAIRLLSRLVTSQGTRNVISREDLFSLVRQDEEIPLELLEATLGGLEAETKLVRRQLRREVYYYEIASEFLVNWIRQRTEEHRLAVARKKVEEAHRRADEAARSAARVSRRAWAMGLLLAVATLLAGIAWRAQGRAEVESLKNTARRQAIEGFNRRAEAPLASLRQISEASLTLLGAGLFPEDLERQALRDILTEVGGVPLTAPGSQLNDIAFSPAAGALAAVGSEGKLWMWRFANGQPEPARSFAGHEGEARSLSWSADGRWLATAGVDGRVLLWNTTADEPFFAELMGPKKESIERVAFHASGEWLVGYTNSGEASIWKITDTGGSLEVVFSTGESNVLQVALHPQDRLLAVAGARGLHLWRWGSVPEPQPIRPMDPPPYLTSLSFSADGEWLALGSGDGATYLLQVGDERWTELAGTGEGGDRVVFDATSTRLYTTDAGCGVTEWRPSDAGRWRPTPVPGPEAGPESLAASPRGRWLAAGDRRESLVHLWAATEGPTAFHRSLRGLEGNPINLVAWSYDETWMATLDVEGFARLWDLGSPVADPLSLRVPAGLGGGQTTEEQLDQLTFSSLAVAHGHWVMLWQGGVLRAWDTDLERVEALAVSPDERWLATTHVGGDVALWKPSDSAVVWPLVLAGHPGQLLMFGADSEWLATAGSSDGIVRLWQLGAVAAGELWRELKGHERRVLALAVSPDGRWLATGSEDAAVILWDLATANDDEMRSYVLRGHQSKVDTVAFDSESRWLATGGGDRKARLWDLRARVPAGKVTELPGHEQGVGALMFRPGAPVLATADRDRLRLWDLSHPQPTAQNFPQSRVSVLRFAPTGDRLLSEGSSEVRLWTLAADRIDSVVLPWERGLREDAASFSPDGRFLILRSTAGAGGVKVFRVRLDDLVNSACHVAGGALFSRAEDGWERTPEKCFAGGALTHSAKKIDPEGMR